MTDRNRNLPTLSWHKPADWPREYMLKGDWNRFPPPRVSRVRRLLIRDQDCNAQTLGFLSCFPALESLRIFSYNTTDLSPVQTLSALRELMIYSLPPKRVTLDFSAIPGLRHLSTAWSVGFVNLSMLRQLRHLHIHHVSGVRHFDFTPHPELRRLDIGPAKGVEVVALDGLSKLEHLGLVLMPRLETISGSEFFKTVTRLDIRGSHRLRSDFLARFTRLEQVIVRYRL